jgi:hypothetical protein
MNKQVKRTKLNQNGYQVSVHKATYRESIDEEGAPEERAKSSLQSQKWCPDSILDHAKSLVRDCSAVFLATPSRGSGLGSTRSLHTPIQDAPLSEQNLPAHLLGVYLQETPSPPSPAGICSDSPAINPSFSLTFSQVCSPVPYSLIPIALATSLAFFHVLLLRPSPSQSLPPAVHCISRTLKFPTE